MISEQEWNMLSEHSKYALILSLTMAIDSLENKVDTLQCELNAHRNTLYAHKI